MCPGLLSVLAASRAARNNVCYRPRADVLSLDCQPGLLLPEAFLHTEAESALDNVLLPEIMKVIQ
jgi:hypothetical protein